MRPIIAVTTLALLAACGQPAPKFKAPERSDAELCADQAVSATAGRADGTPITITCPAD